MVLTDSIILMALQYQNFHFDIDYHDTQYHDFMIILQHCLVYAVTSVAMGRTGYWLGPAPLK